MNEKIREEINRILNEYKVLDFIVNEEAKELIIDIYSMPHKIIKHKFLASVVPISSEKNNQGALEDNEIDDILDDRFNLENKINSIFPKYLQLKETSNAQLIVTELTKQINDKLNNLHSQ